MSWEDYNDVFILCARSPGLAINEVKKV